MNVENVNKEYSSDGKIFYSCQYHVIFSPKYRRSVLVGDIVPRLKELILEKQDEIGYRVLSLEVMPDHVHMLLDANPHIGIFSQATKIKGYTSNVLRGEFPKLKSQLPCLWTRSMFISSVGSVSLEHIKRYLENQKNV